MSASTNPSEYDFGSAFSDEGFSDAAERDPYANPFSMSASGEEPMVDTAPKTTLDGSATFGAMNSGQGGAPEINFAGMGGIKPSTVSPALGVYSPGAVGPKAGLDYVFAEDYKQTRKKSGLEQTPYLAGMAYMFGAVAGGSYGFYAAMKESKGKSNKLRLNAVLNGTGKRGALFANSLGVLALVFSLSETGLHGFTQDDGILNYAGAGAAAGALFKSTRGVRTAGIWGAGGAAIAVATVYASRRGVYGRGLQGVL